jgi:hypothetical protein
MFSVRRAANAAEATHGADIRPAEAKGEAAEGGEDSVRTALSEATQECDKPPIASKAPKVEAEDSPNADIFEAEVGPLVKAVALKV